MTKPTRAFDSLKTAAAGMRKRDVIDVRDGERPKALRVKPTPEQMTKFTFEKVVGTEADGAYRRLPLFETLFKQSDRIDKAGLAALRWYRDAHDNSAASPTRCALNDEGRGGGVPICIPFAIAGMMVEDLQHGTRLTMIERALGSLLPTMRAVAIDDLSFSQIAIERFGGRKVAWIDQQKTRTRDRKGNLSAYVDKVAPISGRHRQIIAEEFVAGLQRLIAVHAPYVSTVREVRPPAPASEAEAALVAIVAAEEIAPVDPAYLDKHGRMLAYADLSDIIRARAFGEQPSLAA